MLRFHFALAVAACLGTTGVLRAQDEPPIFDHAPASSYPDALSIDAYPSGDNQWSTDLEEVPMSAPGQDSHATTTELPEEELYEWPSFWPKPRWFGLRHSSTHGRHVGRGEPFTGTSWLNRPYYAGGQIGPMWFTQSIDENVSTDIDTFGGVFVGWDTDHFWGHEFHLDWATPELRNEQAPDANRTDSLFAWNYSCLYYPWGDAKVRPFWRAGVGNTHFDYPHSDGLRHDEWMFTFPIGIGVKYPIRRWLAARAELTDYISLNEDFPTQHNMALTFGLECRFGAHPPSYWPWNPSRHIW